MKSLKDGSDGLIASYEAGDLSWCCAEAPISNMVVRLEILLYPYMYLYL